MFLTLLVGLVIIFIVAVAMTEFRDMLSVVLLGSRNRSGAAFEPARDIPSIAGKVVLITGAAGDLGRQTAIELARYGRPAHIYIADLPRDDNAKKALARRILHEAYDDSPTGPETTTGPRTEIRFLELDLSSFASIRQCAADFLAQEQRLDVLFLNGGIIRVAPETTPEGYEVHFGINYLGHALLSRLLVPIMQRTVQQQPNADVRVVIVSSEGHLSAPKNGIDFEKLKTDCADMIYAKRYGQSKLALIFLAKDLARQYPSIKVAAVHPGRILTGMATGLQKESLLVRVSMPIAPLFCVPVPIGVRNHLWAATSSDIVSGMYYEPVGTPGKLSASAKDEGLSKRLLEWTDTALEGFGVIE